MKVRAVLAATLLASLAPALAQAQAAASASGASGASGAASLAQIETDAGDAALALLRLEPIGPYGATPGNWVAAIARDPARSRRLIEALFQQLDRHFAYSPSLYSYAQGDALLAIVAQQLPAPPERPELDPLRQLVAARLALQPR